MTRLPIVPRTMLAAAGAVAVTFWAGFHIRADNSSSASGGTTVSLCDGESQLHLSDLPPGQALDSAEAKRVAGEMLQIWRKAQGEERWAAWVSDQPKVAAADTNPAPGPAAPAAPAIGSQPTKFTARDQMLWKREQDKWIAEGYKLYHSPTALGGTIGISCDMCHPDGSNTHPETYPKYQSQLKKVALLRDMINWCIENPEKGKPLAEDDPRMRAVEAYILSTRKGVPLEPGKH
jgi:thiosulfate dehydrogenase